MTWKPCLRPNCEVIFRIHLAAKADLQNIFADQQTFFHRPANRGAMRVGATEVSAPGIVVGVELDHADRAEAFVDRAQNGQQDGVIAADASRARTGLENVIELRRDALEGVLDRQWVDGKVAVIGDPEFFEGTEIQHRVPWPNDGGLLAHMAWAESGAGAVSRTPVIGDADQGDVEFGGPGNMGQAHEGRDPGESGIDKRIDRLRIFPGRSLRTARRPGLHGWREL